MPYFFVGAASGLMKISERSTKDDIYSRYVLFVQLCRHQTAIGQTYFCSVLSSVSCTCSVNCVVVVVVVLGDSFGSVFQ